MRCDEAEALLDIHLDGELPQEMADKLDRHLLRCALCAGQLRSLEQTRTLLRITLQPAEPSPAYRERALARLSDRLAPHLRPTVIQDDGRQWVLPLMPPDS